MEVEIKTDPSLKKAKAIIITPSVTEEISCIVKELSKEYPAVITGCKDNKTEIIDPDNIIRVYTYGRKICVSTKLGEYTLRLRLYEAEELLNSRQFVRISNSEIVNLREVNCFDLNFSGTIRVSLSNDVITYVSRRYVSKLKQVLGI